MHTVSPPASPAERSEFGDTAIPDALSLLQNEHKEIEALFRLYEFGRDRFTPRKRQELAEMLCRALRTHAIMEEEIFYPAIEDRLDDALSLVAEARVEQYILKVLINDIETGMPGSIEYDADVKVLGDYVRHHVADEERSLFAKVREQGIDLAAVGAKLLKRKKQLMESEPSTEGDAIFGGGFAG